MDENSKCAFLVANYYTIVFEVNFEGTLID